MLAGAAAGDADVGLARLAGAVDDAAEHRERQRHADMLEPLLERLDGADHIEALPCAARTGDDPDAAVTDAERLQYLEADPHFLFRLGRERDADRVADPGPQQHAETDRGFDRAHAQRAGFGNAEMQRVVAGIGQPLIGRDREEHVGRLA